MAYALRAKTYELCVMLWLAEIEGGTDGAEDAKVALYEMAIMLDSLLGNEDEAIACID